MNKTIIFITLLILFSGIFTRCNEGSENKVFPENKDSIPGIIDTDTLLPAPGDSVLPIGIDNHLFTVSCEPELLTVKTEVKRWAVFTAWEIIGKDTLAFDNIQQNFKDTVKTNFAVILKKDLNLYVDLSRNNGDKRKLIIELTGVGLRYEYICITQEGKNP